MPATVDSIMSQDLYTVRPSQPSGEVLDMILARGITAAPVVDDDGSALGLVSLRDLAGVPREQPVSKPMTSPLFTITPTTTIEQAGREMAQLGYHHLVVADADGRLLGLVSALDVLRGLVECSSNS